jgi:hypothetical protein
MWASAGCGWNSGSACNECCRRAVRVRRKLHKELFTKKGEQNCEKSKNDVILDFACLCDSLRKLDKRKYI